MTVTLIIALIAFVVYIGISQFYLKIVLGIKPRKFKVKGRNKAVLVMEYALSIITLFYIFFAYFYFDAEPELIVSPAFLILALISIAQGMEERARNKQAKKYYHEWLLAVFYIVIFLIIWAVTLF